MGYRPRFPYKNERKESWWFHWIRYMTWFSFRYWWVVLGLFFLTLFVFFCWCNCWKKSDCVWNARSISVDGCCECNATPLQDTANITFRDTITPRKNDSVPRAPSENCRAFFSGRLVTDDEKYEESVIFQPTRESEYVGSGYYPIASQAFPNSTQSTFDGIALVAGTRIIIYEKQNFQGRVLLDIKGPAIINNIHWKDDPILSGIIDEINTKELGGNLNTIFPKSCRKYSDSDMHSWSNGSLKIMCNE